VTVGRQRFSDQHLVVYAHRQLGLHPCQPDQQPRCQREAELNPWRNQFLSGLYDWNQNASLFKVIPVKEQVAFRLNIDFFNVFNIPGIPKTPSSGSGLIDAQYSGNGARALQFGLRLNWYVREAGTSR
jgi:hypothetical protein